jgi:hypothetical protein
MTHLFMKAFLCAAFTVAAAAAAKCEDGEMLGSCAATTNIEEHHDETFVEMTSRYFEMIKKDQAAIDQDVTSLLQSFQNLKRDRNIAAEETGEDSSRTCSNVCIKCPNYQGLLRRAPIFMTREADSPINNLKRAWIKKGEAIHDKLMKKWNDLDMAREITGDVLTHSATSGDGSSPVQAKYKQLQDYAKTLPGGNNINLPNFDPNKVKQIKDWLGSGDAASIAIGLLDVVGVSVPIPGLGLGVKAIKAGAYYINERVNGCPKKQFSFCEPDFATQFGPAQMDFGLSTYEYIMSIEGKLDDTAAEKLTTARKLQAAHTQPGEAVNFTTAGILPRKRYGTHNVVPEPDRAWRGILACENSFTWLTAGVTRNTLYDHDKDQAFECMKFLCNSWEESDEKHSFTAVTTAEQCCGAYPEVAKKDVGKCWGCRATPENKGDPPQLCFGDTVGAVNTERPNCARFYSPPQGAGAGCKVVELSCDYGGGLDPK